MSGAAGRKPGCGTEHRRRLWAARSLLVVLPLGLVWRLAPLHLAPFAFKYGGSVLWASAVYGAVVCVAPRARPFRVALATLLISTGVEAAKLVYWPPLDRFRETLAGKLLLGRYFTQGALVAYAVAVALSFALDLSLERVERRNAPNC